MAAAGGARARRTSSARGWRASTTEPPAANARRSTTYTFDPRHPVPTIGGNVSGRLKDGGVRSAGTAGVPWVKAAVPAAPRPARHPRLPDRAPDGRRDRGRADPVKLFASSTAVDTDFTAKLIDVYPPSEDFPRGFDLNLTDGIHQGAVPRRPSQAGIDQAGPGLRVRDSALSHRERVQEGAPHSRGYFEQQLPAIRRQPEYGRAARSAPTHDRCGQHRVLTRRHIPRSTSPASCRRRDRSSNVV